MIEDFFYVICSIEQFSSSLNNSKENTLKYESFKSWKLTLKHIDYKSLTIIQNSILLL